jgi:hypothetical protein
MTLLINGVYTLQVVSKALATIDTLLQSSGCEDFVEYFTKNYSEIESCAKSDKAAVQDRAVKILSALGQNVSAPSQSTPAHQSSSNSQRTKPSRTAERTSEPDLLGDFGSPVQHGSSILFMGFQTSAPSEQPSAPAPQPASSNVTDIFGGLNLGGASTSPLV